MIIEGTRGCGHSVANLLILRMEWVLFLFGLVMNSVGTELIDHHYCLHMVDDEDHSNCSNRRVAQQLFCLHNITQHL